MALFDLDVDAVIWREVCAVCSANHFVAFEQLPHFLGRDVPVAGAHGAYEGKRGGKKLITLASTSFLKSYF